MAGCGYGTDADVVQSRENAQQAYDEALQAFASQDFATAKSHLDTAIATGDLYRDVLPTAYVMRAICSASAADFAAAHADLDAMVKGAPNLDEVFAARSYVLEKQGKTKEAKSAWAKARRINRYVRKFKD